MSWLICCAELINRKLIQKLSKLTGGLARPHATRPTKRTDKSTLTHRPYAGNAKRCILLPTLSYQITIINYYSSSSGLIFLLLSKCFSILAST